MQADRTDAIITDQDIVTVTKMNHMTEIQHMEHMNTKATIKKLSSEQYAVLETGEIKDFAKTENRSEGQNSLYQTFKKLRYLINNNFTGKPNELFLTLTFAKNADGWRPGVKDTKYLAKCCRAFQVNLKRKYGNVEFIRVLEPHADGHAHYHMLLRFDDYEKIFIKNEELSKRWGHGFVRINNLKEVDNIGAYVSAYLSDIEFSEQEAFKQLQGKEKIEVKESKGKKFIKGGRVAYYPTGVQIYNKSKGIKMPDRKKMTYKKAKRAAGSEKPHYSKTFEIKSDDFENHITFQQYNALRK